MIHIKLIRKGKDITSIEVTGHAYSNDPGFDLVCAGVSSIAIGTLNACDLLLKEGACELNMKNGENPLVYIKVIDNSQTCQTILNTMLVQCQTIVEQYKNYVEIEEMEG